jgi:hypothetical protein
VLIVRVRVLMFNEQAKQLVSAQTKRGSPLVTLFIVPRLNTGKKTPVFRCICPRVISGNRVGSGAYVYMSESWSVE